MSSKRIRVRNPKFYPDAAKQTKPSVKKGRIIEKVKEEKRVAKIEKTTCTTSRSTDRVRSSEVRSSKYVSNALIEDIVGCSNSTNKLTVGANYGKNNDKDEGEEELKTLETLEDEDQSESEEKSSKGRKTPMVAKRPVSADSTNQPKKLKMQNTEITRLIPWVISALDSKRFGEKLAWEDRTKRVFRIWWMHGKCKGFTPHDFEVFVTWAKESPMGKFRYFDDGNMEKEALSRMKCSFRNAVDSHCRPPFADLLKIIDARREVKLYGFKNLLPEYGSLNDYPSNRTCFKSLSGVGGTSLELKLPIKKRLSNQLRNAPNHYEVVEEGPVEEGDAVEVEETIVEVKENVMQLSPLIISLPPQFAPTSSSIFCHATARRPLSHPAVAPSHATTASQHVIAGPMPGVVGPQHGASSAAPQYSVTPQQLVTVPGLASNKFAIGGKTVTTAQQAPAASAQGRTLPHILPKGQIMGTLLKEHQVCYIKSPKEEAPQEMLIPANFMIRMPSVDDQSLGNAEVTFISNISERQEKTPDHSPSANGESYVAEVCVEEPQEPKGQDDDYTIHIHTRTTKNDDQINTGTQCGV